MSGLVLNDRAREKFVVAAVGHDAPTLRLHSFHCDAQVQTIHQGIGGLDTNICFTEMQT